MKFDFETMRYTIEFLTVIIVLPFCISLQIRHFDMLRNKNTRCCSVLARESLTYAALIIFCVSCLLMLLIMLAK